MGKGAQPTQNKAEHAFVVVSNRTETICQSEQKLTTQILIPAGAGTSLAERDSEPSTKEQLLLMENDVRFACL
jgi:hypothetical protein